MTTATKTRDALASLRKRITNPAVWKALEQAKVDGDVAQQIYDAREAAGLSQTQLAKLIGTTQSVISRLEDANYSGHSLTMLHRIGAALKRPLRVEFTGKPKKLSSAQSRSVDFSTARASSSRRS